MVALPTRPSVPPVSKPRRGEALLDFLDLGQGRRALAAGERLHERSAAHDPVAEVHDRQRVVHRRIVGAHRIEIRAEQERRPARHRHPQLAVALGCGNGWPSARVTPAFCHAS